MRLWHQNIDSVHAFYVNGLLRSLFMSLTTIFVPLFIYAQGLEQWGRMSIGLLLVALYFIVLRIVILVIVFPISKIIETIGFRKSIAYSVIFLIGYTITLLLSSKNINWIWVSAICAAVNTPLYWISRDSALSQDIEGKKMGSKMSYIGVLENISGLLGPFAGGAIVLMFGYQVLFVVATVILIVSIVPLWWMPPHVHHNGVTLRGFWIFLTNGRYLHLAISNFGAAMNDYGASVIWPLILFMQGIADEKLGAIYSIVAVVTILIQSITGKWFDKLHLKKDYSDEGVWGIATVGVALSWIARMFVSGIGQVIPVDVVRQIFGAVYTNFFADYVHLGGKRMGSIAFWVYMEVVYSIGSIFIFSVMAIGIYFGVWKELALITISLWSLATIVMGRESNLR